MVTLSQASLKKVTLTTPLHDGIKLVGIRGREALSELFAYQIHFLVARGRNLDFAAMLGGEVGVALEQDSDHGESQLRRVHGIVRRLGETGEDVTHVAYELEVVPRFWLWTQRVRCRIFQDQTTPEILKQVLDGLDVQFELSHEYRVHTYRTQFRESDYQFACRLMEDEGIYFFFRHGSDGHRLVLADNSPTSEELAGGPLRFSTATAQTSGAPRAHAWKKFQELRPARVTLADHSFQLPEQSLEASRLETATVAAGKIKHQPGLGGRLDLEIFDYPGGYGHRFDGIDALGKRQPARLQQVHEQNERTVRLRVEEQAAATLVIEAAGDDVRPVPGARFELTGHNHADGSYVVTWVEHEIRLPPPISGDAEIGYGNRFGALPLELPFRPPRRTQQPRPDGPQTATVVGPADEEVHCDPFGRIKIHFHWDRAGRRDGSDSCWVRVASSWAGAGFGMVSVPRVGHEVVVAFLDGDVDRPLVTGSVYNANHMPPMPLPDKREYSTITSQSRKGDPARFTGVTLRDGDEKEQLILQATNEIDLDAGNEIVITAPQQWTSNIGETQIQSVGWYFPKLKGPAWKKEGGWDRTTDVLQDILGGGRIDVTRGTHATACIGESNQYTWFSRNEVTIDPFSWSAGQTTGGWSRNIVKGKVPTAKTTAVYGAVQNIGYGPMLNVQSGQVISLVGTHPGFQKYATFHAALSSACCVLPGLYSMTGKNAYLDANSIADLLGNACLAFLVTAERTYAKEKAAQDAINIGAQYAHYPTLGAKAEQFSTLHEELLDQQIAGLAANSECLETHDVTGSYSLRAEWLNLHGMKGIFLNTKDFAPIGLTTQGRLVLAGGWDQLILMEPPPRKTMSLWNGPSSSIEITETSIRLKAGMTMLEIGPNDVKINGANVTIKATSAATVSSPQITVGKAGANGVLKGASWNVES